MENKEYQQTIQSLKEYQTQIQEIVAGRMRSAMTDMVYQLFKDELHLLCGPKYDREAECSRAGSDRGSIYVSGQRVSIKKPRVKKNGKDVEVKTYSALRNYDLFSERIKEHMVRGVSTRDYEPLLDEISDSTGIKKSAVSKAFVKASRGSLDEFNSRDLSKINLVALMIDGVGLIKQKQNLEDRANNSYI